jgi:uncharacterized protein YndB with AHSA1/START domain
MDDDGSGSGDPGSEDMVQVAVARTLAVPADQVWSVFTNLAGRPQWMSTVDRVELLGGNDFEPGTSWREVRGGATGPVTEELVVAAAEAGRACTLTSVGDGAHYQLTYTFTPINGSTAGRTVVSVILEGYPSTRASRLLLLLLGKLAVRTMESSLRADLAALAAACEPAAGPQPGNRPRSGTAKIRSWSMRDMRRKGDPGR